MNPYKGLDDFHFWSRSMSWPAPGRIDPVVGTAPILRHHKIATIGSCFAQHLSREIKSSGFTYYVAEAAPPELPAAQAEAMGYGVFSARYGNVYTVRQALQLFQRAFGELSPALDVWEKDGGYVDAFRPQIEPLPFSSADEVRESARRHLDRVRDVFVNCNVLVFTLGLTEAWRSKADGAVYPIAPGVAGGEFDPERFEFTNFSIDEVRRDLLLFVDRIHEVNGLARIILTVSPVPLIATYDDRHVLVATTYSKSVLRVAADEAERRREYVVYFPSYEIVTSPAAGGRYFGDDLRQVTPEGVRHVMNVFERHFLSPAGGGAPEAEAAVGEVYCGFGADVVCDEEVIERSLRGSGF